MQVKILPPALCTSNNNPLAPHQLNTKLLASHITLNMSHKKQPMKNNQEIIEKIKEDVRQRYSGIVSEEVVQGAIDWWTDITMKAFQAKDAQHKQEMIEMVEGVPGHHLEGDAKGGFIYTYPLIAEWKEEQLNKLKS